MIVNKLSTRQPKVMTVKEIASATGSSTSAVNRAITKHFPNKKQNGKTTFLNQKEVAVISKELKGHHNLFSTEKVRNSVTHLEMLENIQRDLQWLISYNAELQSQNENLRISLDESKEWYSVKRMEKLNRGQTFDWRLLKKESERLGIEVKKVFDQNYGEVNSYHKDVWESLYFDTLDFEE